jgi:AAA domain
MDGDPDLGKSLLTLDLCARLSTGRAFPDGQPGPGLVMDRVFVWQHERDDEDWPWRFPAHAGRLDDALGRSQACLAVIDPIMAFLEESVLYASDQSVRRVLNPLMRLADKHGCTLLLLRHLNKQGGTRAIYRSLGSIAFVAACRFAMLVARDPSEPGRCVLAQVRNSLAGAQPSLAYRLRSTEASLPAVDWLGESPCSADELLAGAARTERGPRDQAAAFLLEFLAEGPRTSQDLWAAAQKRGLSARTLQRAKQALGIRCRRVHRDGRLVSYWLLEGQELPRDPSDTDELDRIFAELEKQFPPRNPLDKDDFEFEGD